MALALSYGHMFGSDWMPPGSNKYDSLLRTTERGAKFHLKYHSHVVVEAGLVTHEAEPYFSCGVGVGESGCVFAESSMVKIILRMSS